MKELKFPILNLLGMVGVVLTLGAAMGACRSDNEEPPVSTEVATGGRGGSGARGGGSGGSKPPTGSGGAGAMDVAMGTVDAPANDGAGNADTTAGDGAADTVATDAAKDAPVDRASDAVVDTRPDGPPRDVPSDLVRNLAMGAACVQNNQCTSGNCIEGFCCNNACGNPCQACSMARTGKPNGMCTTATDMVGKTCGKGCRQFPGQTLLAVVEKVCTAAGACDFSVIPQGIEYCTDTDACTTNTCDEQPAARTARCLKVPNCGGNTCCCEVGATRSCTAKTACTGAGKACVM